MRRATRQWHGACYLAQVGPVSSRIRPLKGAEQEQPDQIQRAWIKRNPVKTRRSHQTAQSGFCPSMQQLLRDHQVMLNITPCNCHTAVDQTGCEASGQNLAFSELEEYRLRARAPRCIFALPCRATPAGHDQIGPSSQVWLKTNLHALIPKPDARDPSKEPYILSFALVFRRRAL